MLWSGLPGSCTDNGLLSWDVVIVVVGVYLPLGMCLSYRRIGCVITFVLVLADASGLRWRILGRFGLVLHGGRELFGAQECLGLDGYDGARHGIAVGAKARFGGQIEVHAGPLRFTIAQLLAGIDFNWVDAGAIIRDWSHAEEVDRAGGVLPLVK